MDLPPAPLYVKSVVATQHYHLSFTFDLVSNATWYAVIVRTNGIEAFRRYSMTNFVTVSNLVGDLESYSFTAIATNSIGASEETTPAAKCLVTIREGTNILTMESTNRQQFFTNLHPMSIDCWSFYRELRRD